MGESVHKNIGLIKELIRRDRGGYNLLYHTRGERFINAFDAAFGLQPITEFPWLLKYFDKRLWK